ncbi:imm11 family protein [Enterovibrio baiacu]|uniref:imm11 family protein n=1 Tax=Enterovibrio baiacu TaxID=2491023 RepID=UPI003D14C917
MAADIVSMLDSSFPQVETTFVNDIDRENIESLSSILEGKKSSSQFRAINRGEHPIFAQFEYMSAELSEDEIALLPSALVSMSGKMINDFDGWFLNLNLVSEMLKKGIQKTEPSGGHQFIPVNIIRTDGTTIGLGYFWKVLNVVDAINLDSEGVKPIGGREIKRDSYLSYKEGDIYIHSDKVSGKAAWHDIRRSNSFIISTALVEFINREKINNIRFRKFMK